MRLRSPIRRIGVSTARWMRWRQKCREAVALRAAFKCEACGSNLRPLEWCHIAGRGNVVAEPFASSPELTMGLCSAGWEDIGCHNKIDRAIDLELREMLRWKAVSALMKRYRLGWVAGDNAIDAIREAVRHLEAEGWVYSPERNEIVRR